MKKWIVALVALTLSSSARSEDLDLDMLAKSYFDAWMNTQSPNATPQDIENYLSFLTDDVGHQHLPYDPDDSRSPSGKAEMREGMSFYLGAHTAYSASLKQVIPGHNVVVITYSTHSEGTHPQTGEEISLYFDTMEVLEIEDGKVALIRKYEE